MLSFPSHFFSAHNEVTISFFIIHYLQDLILKPFEEQLDAKFAYSLHARLYPNTYHAYMKTSIIHMY